MRSSRLGAECGFHKLTGLSLLAVVLPIVAHSQEANNNEGGTLEEITVTAQRVSESLSRTPLSITVLDSSQLEKQAVESLRDLQISVPGLTIKTSTDSQTLNFSIRGQTLDGYTGSQPAVQPYLNEVPVTTNLGSAFYDMGSVQVLKGPQGTLFGRNVTGGAVLFTTAQPNTDHIEGYLTQRLGDYADRETLGAINLPFAGSTAALRLAFDTVQRDGFTKNLFDNTVEGELHRNAMRASLLLHPTDSFTNTTVVDFNNSPSTGATPGVLYSVYRPGSTNNGIPLTATTSVLYSPALDSAIGVPGAWTAYLAAHPGRPAAGFGAYLPVQQALGPYTITADVDTAANANGWTISNITSYNVLPGLELKNIVGFVSSNSTRREDFDESPYSVENGVVALVDKTYTEEFQVVGHAFGDSLSYIAGLYYDHAKENNDTRLSFYDVGPDVPATPVRYYLDSFNEAKAGYAQVKYDLGKVSPLSGLSATAGYRYTWNKATEYVLSGSAVYNVPGVSNEVGHSFNEPSYHFGLEEQLTPDILLYATARRSFRTGGFNPYTLQLPGTASVGGSQFNSEIAKDVELGAKFQGEVLGIPSRLNVALYDELVTGVQKETYVQITGRGTSGLTVNVPAARIKGVEVDGAMNFTRWLKTGASLAYTDPIFTGNTIVVFGQSTTFGPYPDTPKWTATGFVEFTQPLPRDIGTLSIRSDVYYQTQNYFGSLDATINPGTRIPAYAVVNFRAAVEDVGGSKLSVATYVKNAFNRIYYTGGDPAGSAVGYNWAVPGDPRTYFVELTYKY